MPVELTIFLFGKPAWEIEGLEGEQVTKELVERIRSLADELRDRLRWAADVIEKLLDNGWEAYGTLYCIELYKDVSLREAREELRRLGLEELIPDLRVSRT